MHSQPFEQRLCLLQLHHPSWSHFDLGEPDRALRYLGHRGPFVIKPGALPTLFSAAFLSVPIDRYSKMNASSASGLADIEHSWNTARIVDIIFVVFACIFLILRVVSKYTLREGMNMTDTFMMLASVGDLAKSFWVVRLTCTDTQFCVICSSHLA